MTTTETDKGLSETERIQSELAADHKADRRRKLGFGVLVCIVTGIFVLYGVCLVTEAFGSGEFGDAFGVLTGYLTALAVVAAGFSLVEQRRSLAQQQREFRKANQDLRSQMAASERASIRSTNATNALAAATHELASEQRVAGYAAAHPDNIGARRWVTFHATAKPLLPRMEELQATLAARDDGKPLGHGELHAPNQADQMSEKELLLWFRGNMPTIRKALQRPGTGVEPGLVVHCLEVTLAAEKLLEDLPD